ncbi:MAG TPA: MOSC domain-containing protein [Pseudolabrys sp.]|nr:MOSC domain-containing protein [Pseudolabrys sp.]
MTDPFATIAALYRYPVKGLSPQALTHTSLAVGATVPSDRRYAIENGPSGFDPTAPAYFPKQRFLMLMRNERLAALRTDFDEATQVLTIQAEGREVVRADLSSKEGRLAVEAFFRRFMPQELRGAPKVLHASGHSFSDVAKKVVSIINLASVQQIETAIGAPVDPLRFRANVFVSGWPAWREFELLDREITMGTTARLKVVKRIVRCAATEVDPATGIRDLQIPKTLMRNFGHSDCGVYAEVIAAGDVAIGDRVL